MEKPLQALQINLHKVLEIGCIFTAFRMYKGGKVSK